MLFCLSERLCQRLSLGWISGGIRPLLEVTQPFLGDTRPLTSAQAASALRPFYFAVHPDLFGQFPEAQSVNEQSLKQLNGYLESLLTKRPPGPALRLPFFIRSPVKAPTAHFVPPIPRSDAKSALRKVSVTLGGTDAYGTVKGILETCSLPTTHLPSAPLVSESGFSPASVLQERYRDERRRQQARSSSYDDERPPEFWTPPPEPPGNGFQAAITRLAERLSSMAPRALNTQRTHAALVAEVSDRIAQLRLQIGIHQVDWESPWTLSHVRGALISLKRVMANRHWSELTALEGQRMRFGRRPGLMSDGWICLALEQVPEQWLRILCSFSFIDQCLSQAEKSRKEVSNRLLGGAEIQPPRSIEVRLFHPWLESLLLSANQKRRPLSRDLHKAPPISIIIANTPPYVAKDGTFCIPIGATLAEIIDFVENNVEVATKRKLMWDYELERLQQLKADCVEQFGLDNLSWDEWETPADAVQHALESLLAARRLDTEGTLSRSLAGQRLSIGRWFHILENGCLEISAEWQNSAS